MTKEIDYLIPGSRNMHLSPPMTLHAFRAQAQQYLKDLSEAKDVLSYPYKLFGRSGKDIWPDQCDRALNHIRTVNEFIHDLCHVLDNTAQLPEAVVSLRYPLAITVHYMNEQLDELMILMRQFRTICRTSSPQMIRQQKEIQIKIETVVNCCDDILQRIYSLLDKARFQERKLASL